MSTSIFQSYLGAVTSQKHAFLAGGNSSGQAISNTTVTTIDLDTNHFDPGGNFDTSTNAYTVPVDGIYYFHGQVLWQAASVFNAGERTDLRLYRDSTHLAQVTKIIIPEDASGASFTAFLHIQMNGLVELTAGQEMTMRIYQDTGVTQYLYSGGGASTYTSFSGYLIQAT